MKPEEEYRSKIDPKLTEYFNIQTEVYSTNGLRIDYILQCKESGVLFGLEVKSLEHKRGIDISAFMEQAKGYANEYWISNYSTEPTRVMVFIAPALSKTIKQISRVVDPITNGNKKYYYPHHDDSHTYHSNVDGFISCSFNVGCLKSFYNGNSWGFIYNNKIIWNVNSYRNRFRKENYNLYAKKLGLDLWK